MNEKTETADPDLALAELWEAADLLTALRQNSEAGERPLSSAGWTLTAEIRRRINSAIACLDVVVPAPGDEPETPEFSEARQGEDGPKLERRQYALLIGEGIYSVVSGIRGIADALEGPLFDDINDNISQELVLALKLLTDRLYDATYSTPMDIECRVRNALEAPDSRAEAMAKRLHDHGFYLWSDPTQPNVYGVSGRRFAGMENVIVSIDEIEDWLETRVNQAAAMN